jgi:4-hydroxythreonine-4-phosphate dehydrogenase
MTMPEPRPRVALTMGDVAGIGPEVIARAWSDPALHALCVPLVIGDAAVLRKALALVGSSAKLHLINRPEEAEPQSRLVPCLTPASVAAIGSLRDLAPGRVDPRAGRAAFAFLIAAIDLALAGQVDAITTLPLNKEALRLAGIAQPGHTEILAERCGVTDHAMMLYLAAKKGVRNLLCEAPSGSAEHRVPAREKGVRNLLFQSPTALAEQKVPDTFFAGLGVVHVTLHVALREVFKLLTMEAVASKIRLADAAMRPLCGGSAPHIAVSSLNPHAGEHGLFGDEEIRIIQPAVESAQAEGIDVGGPYPNDTLFHQALSGAFDAVVAMYHDQGHIALKTAGFRRAVNVTLGLPIVRTSVAHGTAFDIAWQGVADPSSLIEAVRVAVRLVAAGGTGSEADSRGLT